MDLTNVLITAPAPKNTTIENSATQINIPKPNPNPNLTPSSIFSLTLSKTTIGSSSSFFL